jgi:hypothetical protein
MPIPDHIFKEVLDSIDNMTDEEYIELFNKLSVAKAKRLSTEISKNNPLKKLYLTSSEQAVMDEISKLMSCGKINHQPHPCHEIDKKLESLGWHVIRFTDDQIDEDIGSIISAILSFIQDKN